MRLWAQMILIYLVGDEKYHIHPRNYEATKRHSLHIGILNAVVRKVGTSPSFFQFKYDAFLRNTDFLEFFPFSSFKLSFHSDSYLYCDSPLIETRHI